MAQKLKLNSNLAWPVVILIIALGAFILKPWQNKTPETITVSAQGKTQVAPDVAKLTATIETQNNNLDTARSQNQQKVSALVDKLKSLGIEEKDIKTEGYNSYPKYSNPEVCPMYYPANGIVPPCRGGESKIVGYTVSQSVSVKIRKVDDASKIVDGINNRHGQGKTRLA